MNTRVNCGDALDVNVRAELAYDKNGMATVGYRIDIDTLREDPGAALTLADIIRLREALTHAIEAVAAMRLPETDGEAMEKYLKGKDNDKQ